MLFNLWPPDEDPALLLAGPVRKRWAELLEEARAAALGGRIGSARERLFELRALAKGNTALGLAVRLELARTPRHQRRLERILRACGDADDRATAVIRAVATSERHLFALRRFPAEEIVRAAPRALAANRVVAVGELGPRHPAVGLLETQLAACASYLRDHEGALEALERANVCFLERPEVFVHERSDVLAAWASAAIELGELTLAEALVMSALGLKGVGADGQPAGGIPLHGPSGRRVLDRQGIAHCWGILGKLRYRQGRLDEALQCFMEDGRHATRPRDQGFIANQIGRIYLRAGAHDLAQRVLEENARQVSRGPVNQAIAWAWLGKTELLRSCPDAPGPAASSQLLQRRRARDAAHDALRRAGRLTGRLREPVRSGIVGLLDAVGHLADAQESLDRGDQEGFEQFRRALLDAAATFWRTRQPMAATDVLRDLLQLEAWAWRTHGYVPAAGDAETYGRLLDLLERMGAHEHLGQVERWAERTGYGDIHQVLLDRYLPEVTRAREIGAVHEMTVIFGDIRDFSLHCQGLEPDEVVAMLAELFKAINPVVLDHGGSILRYQGDSILIAFNLGDDQPDHADRALRCALDMQRAVDRVDRARRARRPGARRLRMPIGVHAGQAAVAHLTIPGRREVTVYGDAVNLAARIQGKIRDLRGWLDERGVGTDLLVSDDVLRGAKDGAFRAFPIGKHTLKGYAGSEPALHSILPAVPCRTSFVGWGARIRPSRGFLAIDVGNLAAVGVIDHHQAGGSGCSTSLVLEHPDWVTGTMLEDPELPRAERLEVVLHVEPDFDACAALFVALEVVEGRLQRADPARRAALEELAKLSVSIDRGHVDLDRERPESSPYALLTAAVERAREQARTGEIPWWEVDRRCVERGVQLVHLALERAIEEPGRPFGRIFADRIPPTFAPEAERVRRDAETYAQDRQRIEERAFRVPRRDAPERREEQRCAVITEPASMIFKEWARNDGFPMLCVEYPVPPRVEVVAGRTVSVPRARFIISVLPGSRLSLAELGHILETEEARERVRLGNETGIDLVRRGAARPGFEGPDPWYDGRSDTLEQTIVASPHDGTVLCRERVLDLMARTLG